MQLVYATAIIGSICYFHAISSGGITMIFLMINISYHVSKTVVHKTAALPKVFQLLN